MKILSGIGIIICGLFSILNLSEFYKIGITKDTGNYPFGGEGPVPYFYKTAELYSSVNLTWGVIFLCVTAIGIWNWKLKKINDIKIIGLTYGFILLQIVHNMFGYFI